MKKRVLALALIAIMLISVSFPAFAAPTDEKTLRHTVARIYVGIMSSVNEVFYDTEWYPVGSGTGFFVGSEGQAPQYLITNQHVIDDYLYYGEGSPIQIPDEENGGYLTIRAQIRVYFEKDDYAEAYVVEVGDPTNAGNAEIRHPKDFAILRLSEPTEKRAALPLCIPTQAVSDANRMVIAVGFPGVADNELFKSISISGEKDSRITSGMVNKIFTETGTGVQLLEFDAKINHGNSGGPLVLDNGAAIGVTTWGINEESENIFYAVGMETIKPYLDRNNVPYTLLADGSTNQAPADTPEPGSVPVPPPVNPGPDWKQIALYAVLGAAIIGVVVVLIILLRKPAPEKGPSTRPQPPKVDPPSPPAGSARVLIGVEGPLKDRRFTIEKGKAIYVGRDKKKCRVLFPNGTPGVSNQHCKISFDGKTATITDLNSTYGTAVDGKKLTPNMPTTLHRGLSIDIGSRSNRFTLQ